MVEIIKNPPKAQDFMEASRSFGNYDLALSLADLIDNSITAGATIIDIFAHYDERVVHILDNGKGMNKNEIISSMKMASRNPKTDNIVNDLGRFGLGLKTASFAQCDCLTVLSNNGIDFCGAEWDLNDCEDFSMKIFNKNEVKNEIHKKFHQPTGTEVRWTNLTRLVEDDMLEINFNSLLSNASEEISLIFHRYLSGELNTIKKNKITISINGMQLDPFDPFYIPNKYKDTQVFKPESVYYKKKKINIKLHILPHSSKLNKKETNSLAGKEGYVKNSGFYIYREHRLIIKGTWFKLFPHGELSKLARVRVDIPNSLDSEWKITVDKSEAQLPIAIKNKLTNLIKNKFSVVSGKVIRSRGSSFKNHLMETVWEETKHKDNTKSFRINKNHSLINTLLKSSSDNNKQEVRDALEVIEKCLPLEAIHSLISDNPQNYIQGFTSDEKILELASNFYNIQKNNNLSDKIIFEQLKITDPFSNYYEKIIHHLKPMEFKHE